MGLKKVTIPAAGETEIVNLIGRSVYIYKAPFYSTVENTPKLSFGSEGDEYPIEQGNGFPADENFTRVVITGTSESEGDEIWLISSKHCINPIFNPNGFEMVRATTKTSFTVDLDNTTDELTEVDLVNDDGLLPSKIFVSVREGDAVWIFNPELDTDPAQTGGNGLGTILKAVDATNGIPGDLLEIEGLQFILAFRFRARVAGETPVLTVHLEY